MTMNKITKQPVKLIAMMMGSVHLISVSCESFLTSTGQYNYPVSWAGGGGGGDVINTLWICTKLELIKPLKLSVFLFCFLAAWLILC